jgi:hypothetical protein
MMGWWIGIVLAYCLGAGIIMETKPGPELTWALVVGFFTAHFLGLGLGFREKGDSFSSGLKAGALFGLHWAAYMLGLAAVSGVLFLALVAMGA